MVKTLEFPDDVRPDFQGFSEDAFDFLVGLEENNERTWFKARKDIYDQELKFTMECLLAEFAANRAPRGFPVVGNPARGLFRIYRDVRFSRDKNPYKTHVGAVLSRSGEKGDPGIVYVHFQPGNSFIAAGYYSPGKELLHAWRVRMADKPGEFLELVDPFLQPDARFPLEHRDALKTFPRGFKEHTGSAVSDYLKWKHFLIRRNLGDHEVRNRKLVDAVKEIGEVARPLLEYGWRVLATAFEDDQRRPMRSKE